MVILRSVHQLNVMFLIFRKCGNGTAIILISGKQHQSVLTTIVSQLRATVILTWGRLSPGVTAGNVTLDDFGGRSW